MSLYYICGAAFNQGSDDRHEEVEAEKVHTFALFCHGLSRGVPPGWSRGLLLLVHVLRHPVHGILSVLESPVHHGRKERISRLVLGLL